MLTDRSKPTVLKYFSRFQATSAGAIADDFASPSIRCRSASTDGIVVIDGQPRLAPQGHADPTPVVPSRVRRGPRRRDRNLPQREAGRRPAPAAVVRRAQTLTAKRSPPERLPLQVLANHFHVHVRTLRAAAHDGRLAATFGVRPYFGRLTARATREAVATFMAIWYRRTYGRGRRCLVPVCRVKVPANYVARMIGLQRQLGLSQHQLAATIGAASKTVVYQWESGKRKPSPVFWLRLEQLTGAATSSTSRL